MNKLRKAVSMTMVVSFVVVILNSIVLYIVPEGRVAYWADWTLFGLTKSQWGEQHTTVGFLFIFAGLLHIYLNWRRIVSYLQNKLHNTSFRTQPFMIGALITAIFVAGTYYQLPPMSTIIQISEHFKASASDKYGEPPYGHAESSSLKMFCKKEGIELQQALQLLLDKGIAVSSEQATIKEIAILAQRSPQQIYNIIKPASLTTIESPSVATNTFPDAPKSGWGNKTLHDVCMAYALDEPYIIEQLGQQGISAKGSDKIKQIATAHDVEPMGFFEILHAIVYQ